MLVVTGRQPVEQFPPAGNCQPTATPCPACGFAVHYFVPAQPFGRPPVHHLTNRNRAVLARATCEDAAVGIPFEKLMELVAALDPEDKKKPLGEFAGRWHEPVERIMDAIDAVRVLHGERTYI